MTANTDSWQPINQQFEDYIQGLLDYAKSTQVLSEALETWDMSWEEYEQRLRELLSPKIFINTTATTGDKNAITKITGENTQRTKREM